MKVAIWIVKDRELLYDTDTDEIIIRDVPVKGDDTGRVDRIPFSHVLLAHAKGTAFRPKPIPVNKKKH